MVRCLIFSLIFLCLAGFSSYADVNVLVSLGGNPIAGAQVESYLPDGTKLNESEFTNSSGVATFPFTTGEYKFRVTQSGVDWFSQSISAPATISLTIPSLSYFQLIYPGNDSGHHIRPYQISQNGDEWLGYTRVTDSSGFADFALEPGTYRFRFSYNGHALFSSNTQAGTTAQIYIPGDTYIQVTKGELPISGATVEIYDSLGVKYNYSRSTGANGIATFTLPQGIWTARHTYQGQDIFSEPFEAGQSSAISVASIVFVTGDTSLSSQIWVRAYEENGSYTGINVLADVDGMAEFPLHSGLRKYRISYNGLEYFSSLSPSGASTQITLPTPTSVQLVQNGAGVGGLSVEAYIGTTKIDYSRQTNSSGLAQFSLEDGDYRFRATLNNIDFYSQTISSGQSIILSLPDKTQVSIANFSSPEAVAISVYQNSSPLEIAEMTNSNGSIQFTLPEGTYQFRLSYNGAEFFSPLTSSGGTTQIQLPTPIQLQLMEQGQPLISQRVELHDENGVKLNYSRITDSQGQAAWHVAEGIYLLRLVHEPEDIWLPLVADGQSILYDINPPEVIPTTSFRVLEGNRTPFTTSPVYLYSTNGSPLGTHSEITSLGYAFFHTTAANPVQGMVYVDEVPWFSNAISLGEEGLIEIPPYSEFILYQNETPLPPQTQLNIVDFNSGASVLPPMEVTVNGRASSRIPTGVFQLVLENSSSLIKTIPFITPVQGTLSIDFPNPTLVEILEQNPPYGANRTVILDSPQLSNPLQRLTNRSGKASFWVSGTDLQFQAEAFGRTFSSDIVQPGETASILIPKATSVCFSVSGQIPVSSSVEALYPTSEPVHYSLATDSFGCSTFYLPPGDYRFRLTHSQTEYLTQTLEAETSHDISFGSGWPPAQITEISLSSPAIVYATSAILAGKIRWGQTGSISLCGTTQTIPLSASSSYDFELPFDLNPLEEKSCDLTFIRENEFIQIPLFFIQSQNLPSLASTNPANGTTLSENLLNLQGQFDGYVGEILCKDSNQQYFPVLHNGINFTCQGVSLSGPLQSLEILTFEPVPQTHSLYFNAPPFPVPELTELHFQNPSISPDYNPYSPPQNLSVSFQSDGPGLVGYQVRNLSNRTILGPIQVGSMTQSGSYQFNLWDGRINGTPAWEGNWYVEVVVSSDGNLFTPVGGSKVHIWY